MPTSTAPPRDTVRWGNAAAAGRECVTDKAPHGVPPRTYRTYRDRAGAPKPRRRNPETGEQEYDLDEVAKWNADRPKMGRRSIAKGAPARYTDARFEVLDAARRGQLTELVVDGRPLLGKHRYAVTELSKAGFVADTGGAYSLTDAGRRLRDEWATAHRPEGALRPTG